jgi:hypothetical protein
VLSANELATLGTKADIQSATRVVQQMGLPSPTPAQVDKIREQARQANAAAPVSGDNNMMSGNMMAAAGPAASAAGDLSPEAIAVAFALGSPQFQKR